jgi:hypothetical protein
VIGDPALPREISAYPRLITRLYDLFRQIDRELKQYHGEATINPSDIAPGATTTATATIVGAGVGDSVRVFPPYSLQGVMASAYISAVEEVTLVLYNPTGGNVNLDSGLWKFKAEKY